MWATWVIYLLLILRKITVNILILGNGGREYSIGLAISKEIEEHNIFFMPGNGATTNLGTNINIKDYKKLAHWAKENSIELTIVGPEAPLVDGVVDIFKENGLTVKKEKKKSRAKKKKKNKKER